MKQSTTNNTNRRKTNIFVIFLICSALIWLISKLSETYTQRSSFGITYLSVPDSLMMTGASKENIDVRLRASGFQFLSFNFGRKDVSIDLSQLRANRNSYYINKENYQKQIENQLPGNMSLLEIDQDTLFVYFEKLYSKEVRVVPNIDINLAQNYLLEGPLSISPSSIMIKGPQSEIAGIDQVRTVQTALSDLSENFSAQVSLQKPEELLNTSYSSSSVEISGEVFRFSEQLIEVPVKVINLPEGSEIKTFPNTISLLCKARIDRLKNLRAQEFELVADYNSRVPNTKKLSVQLISQPEDVYDAQLKENEVEYILIRR